MDKYQFVRGSELQNDAYTGPDGSLSVDKDNEELRLHDGVNQGGTRIPKKEDVVLKGMVGGEDVTSSTGTQSVSESLNRRGVVFESVTDMQGFPGLQVGTKVRTLGYYTPGDGGGNDYEIVDAGTGTDDGGSYIDLANGLQAKGLFGSGTGNFLMFGAVGDGIVDDTIAVTSATSSPSILKFYESGEKTYLISSPVMTNDSISIMGKVNLIGGAGGSYYYLLDIHSESYIENISIKIQSGSTFKRGIMVTGHDTVIGRCSVVSEDTQATEGSNLHAGLIIDTSADNTIIDYVYVENFDKAVNVYSSGVRLNNVTIKNYIRGVWVRDTVTDFVFGKLHITGPSSSSAFLNSGLLISGGTNIIGDSVYIEDSTTHGVRFGGAGANDVRIGSIKTLRAGGCGVKFRCGHGNAVRNVEIGSIHCVDSGNRNPTSPIFNDEGVLIDRVEGGAFGSIHITNKDNPTSGHTGLRIRSSSNLDIASLYVKKPNREAILLQNEQSDDDANTIHDTISDICIKSTVIDSPGRHVAWLELDTTDMKNISILGPCQVRNMSTSSKILRVTTVNGGVLSGTNNFKIEADRPASGLLAVGDDGLNDTALLHIATYGPPISTSGRRGSLWQDLDSGYLFVKNQAGTWVDIV